MFGVMELAYDCEGVKPRSAYKEIHGPVAKLRVLENATSDTIYFNLPASNSTRLGLDYQQAPSGNVWFVRPLSGVPTSYTSNRPPMVSRKTLEAVSKPPTKEHEIDAVNET